MTTTTRPDPFITYRYADGRQVEAQCSSAHLRIASGEGTPIEADRMAYVAWCRGNGVEVPDHVPATISRDPGEEEDAADRIAAAASREILEAPPAPTLVAAAASGHASDEEAGDGEEEEEGAGDVPQKIPADFPHATELAKAGITTFDGIPANPTTVKGIGRVGARLIADALARR